MTFEIHAVTPDRLADLADLFALVPCGFECVATPSSRRVVMRRDLG